MRGDDFDLLRPFTKTNWDSMSSAGRRIWRSVVSFVRLKDAFKVCPGERQLSSAKPKVQKNILYSAICVERYPVITAPKNDIEQRFEDMMSQLELENSYLSDHELRLTKEKQAAKKKQESEEEDLNVEGETVTGLDLEDKWEAELKKFTPAPRESEVDRTDDKHSLQRKLDSTLYLLVKQDIEGRYHWVLPQATWEEGETLRETAERALSSVCGDIQATFLGNAPCAVAKYEPRGQEAESGIKLFFFKAWYRDGTVQPNQAKAEDYLWVTREEIPNYCQPAYHKHLKKFIFDL